MKLRKVLSLVTAGVVAASLAVSASAANAGLHFQTATYGFRNSIYQSEAYYWVDDEQTEYDTWKYTDADITGDGQYTVSFEKDDADKAQSWNMLRVMLAFTEEDQPDLQVTVDSMKVDGNEIAAAKDAKLIVDSLAPDDFTDEGVEFKAGKYYFIHLFNTYGKDADGNTDKGVINADDYGQKVEVTFTVSGFKGGEANNGGDNAEETTAADNTPAPGANDGTGDGKDPAHTGIDGVAVVAGLAVLATGAIVFSKKRK